MSEPISIAPAGNTYNPCLLILRDKGYHLWVEQIEGQLLWHASKSENLFMADSPPELLGIVMLGEILGENWNQQNPNIIKEVTRSLAD